MKKSLMLISLVTMLAGSAFAGTTPVGIDYADPVGTSGLNAGDNTVVINLSAVVTRHCHIEFDSNGSHVVNKTMKWADDGLISPAGGTSVSPTDTGTGAAYVVLAETCNDDYMLTLQSSNGKLQGPGANAVPYTMQYMPNTSDGSLASAASLAAGAPAPGSIVNNSIGQALQLSSAELGAGVTITKRLTDYQAATGVANDTFNELSQISFSAPTATALPVGTYSDAISIQMSAAM